jgi:hypothetical protein
LNGQCVALFQIFRLGGSGLRDAENVNRFIQFQIVPFLEEFAADVIILYTKNNLTKDAGWLALVTAVLEEFAFARQPSELAKPIVCCFVCTLLLHSELLTPSWRLRPALHLSRNC